MASPLSEYDAADFRSRVTDSENASMWQSLSFKTNYKAAYCLAVCPAAEEYAQRRFPHKQVKVVDSGIGGR